VLDLGQPGEETVNLLETENSMIGRYICLSHCWGQKQPIVTTKDTIKSWKKEIPLALIPRMFQDAIAFTRDLQIRYLWIDCLCIIQDDSHDWQQQAGRMAQIYQNSYVTLAATSSQDYDRVLFHQFEPRSEMYVLKGLDPSRKNFDIYVQKRRPHWTDKYTHRDVFLHAEFPLMTRAWVYQERLLAPRVLHFCLEELVWECNEELACQCGSFNPPGKSKNVKNLHADILHKLQAQKFSPPPRKFTKDLDAAEEESNSDVLIEKWNDLVSDYSKLEITYDRDRLPALAGLAERMQRLRKDNYVAGLWENDLLKSLCWWVSRQEPSLPMP